MIVKKQTNFKNEKLVTLAIIKFLKKFVTLYLGERMKRHKDMFLE